MAIVGNLVANLVADTSGFTSGLGRAQGALSAFVGGLGAGAGFGAITAGVGLAKDAFGSIVGIVSDGVTAFRESQQAGKKLDAVLASTGGAAGLTGDEIRALASDLQMVTNFEDDATVAAAGVLATFKEIKGDTFKSAIVAAQDLSSVMGQDLQSSVVQIGKALNDPIKGVTALRRVGVSFTQEQLSQIKNMQSMGNLAGAQSIILQELQSEFGGAAKAMADPLVIFTNMLGEISEGIGSAVLPSLQLIADTIVSFIVPAGSSMGEVFTYVGNVLLDYVKVGIDIVKQGVAAATYVVENFGLVSQLAIATAALGYVQLESYASHFFESVLPAYFNWFTDNWNVIWFTALDTTLTVLANLGTNIRTAMKEIWDFISSGGKNAMEMAWTPLTEGAKDAIRKMPEIPERAISEVERILKGQVGILGAKVGAGLATAIAGATEEGAAAAKPDVPQFQGGEGTGAGNLQGQKSKGAGIAVAGSKEALSSIFGSMRDDKLQERIANAAERQLAVTERMADHIEDMADSEEEVVEI